MSIPTCDTLSLRLHIDNGQNTLKAQPMLFAILVLLPISWGLEFAHQDPVAIFVTSLLAIVPLAGGLGFATEELAHRMGDAWGGLLNATFGYVVVCSHSIESLHLESRQVKKMLISGV